MKRILQITGLVLLLPVGAILTMMIASGLKHLYDDSGTGLFHGLVHAQLHGQKSFFFVDFKGETKPKWLWARPDNYKYQTLQIEWDSGGAKGNGVLDLSTLVLTTTTNSFILSEASLVNMLRPTNNQDKPPSGPEISELFSLLIAAGKGELPRPRHHYHYFKGPLEGSMAHFSCGWRIPYSVYAWCLIWAIIVAFRVTKQMRLKRRSRTNHSSGTREPVAGSLDAQ